MKILHIDPDDIENPQAGGGPERTWQIYRRLAARHQITVLTPTFDGCTREKMREGVRFVRLGRKLGGRGASHHLTFLLSLPAAVRRFDHDLLVEDFMPPASVTFTPLVARRPLIASVQWFFARSLSEQLHVPFHLAERWGVRWYHNFIVLSGSMRRHIETLQPRARCAVIPEGAADDLFALPFNWGDFILYLGRVDVQQKGVDLLLRALALIPPAERLPLVLAGHGFQWRTVQALISELGLNAWVRLHGRVDAAERARLFAGCRFTCVPSREETFGMVIAESCAAGKAVVVFDRAPMNEVAAPDSCELVEPLRVDRYAEAMRRLLREDEATLRRRGDLCRAWAGRYRWDAIALEQERFYTTVLEEAST